MPIRFRCAYCNQLMGIAHRKAGTVVRCPTCSGQVIVPDPEPQAATQSPRKKPKNLGGVFEESDLDEVLQKPPTRPASSPQVGPVSPAASPGMGQMIDFEDDASAGLVLTTGKLVLLAIIMLMLLALAFFAGLLVGRSSLS